MAARTTLVPLLDTREIMKQVGLQANTKLARAMSVWAASLDRNMSRKKGLQQVHKQTASLAQDAIMRAYMASGIGDRPSYRQNDFGKLRRDSGGAMERALRDPKLITSDKNRIRFIDKRILDQNARQWYRLNFGALPKKSRTPAVGSMKFFGRANNKRATLQGYGPSKPFLVPSSRYPAIWSSSFKKTGVGQFKRPVGVGRDALYIKRKGMSFVGDARFFRSSPNNRPQLSKGIQGKRFLDQGARAINLNYPKLITQLFREWEAEAKNEMRKVR